MIYHERLDRAFRQNGNSCVLASYAIVSNYYTKQPIYGFFEDYCRHYGIAFTDQCNAEIEYSRHFDALWKSRKCKGYEIIRELHCGSDKKSFKMGRDKFDVEFIPDTKSQIQYITQELVSGESLLNITIFRSNEGCHSLTIGREGDIFWCRDTASTDNLIKIDSMNNLGQLRDGILYKQSLR
jgi:hypothetical protein